MVALIEDEVKTNEIEGEVLSVQSVSSSIARRMGVKVSAVAPQNRHVEVVGEMVLNATTGDAMALSAERFFGWHVQLQVGW